MYIPIKNKTEKSMPEIKLWATVQYLTVRYEETLKTGPTLK